MDGFKVRLGREELHDHLRERAIHHAKEAEEGIARIGRIKAEQDTEKLEKLLVEAFEPGARNLFTIRGPRAIGGGQPLDRATVLFVLEKQVKRSQEKAKLFDFYHGHLPQEIDHFLDRKDLLALEYAPAEAILAPELARSLGIGDVYDAVV